MTSPPGELALAAEFPAATRGQWRELVLGVLDKSGIRPGDPDVPEDALAATTYDGITVHPLYTAADTTGGAVGMPGLAPFVRGGRIAGGAWDVRQRHANPDVGATNEAALADLENGVTSLWLLVGAGGVPLGRLGAALDGVLLDLAGVVLDAGGDYREAAAELFALYTERRVPAGEVSGSLGADPLGLAARTGADAETAGAAELATRCAADYAGLRAITVDALPYHTAGGSDSEELGASIASGVEYLRALTERGLTAEQAAGQLEFRYAAGADQFLTIAKLRAARRLWARVTGECGAAVPQRQHAVSSPAMMTTRDRWVNILRGTLACFGAGMGGADAVTVAPFDAALGLPDEFARRIARNTNAILLEEARLAGVIDPAGGSWYVERLTDELAHAAWDRFTDIERHGGMVASLRSGMVADRLAETWRVRSERIAHRSDPITGVSEFPDLHERLAERETAGTEPAGGLPVMRYAEVFERLRDRSDAHLSRTGARPSVFLATIGPLAAHTARASFATNLFGAGGIEAVNPGEVAGVDELVAAFTASATRVACLCGTDSAYREQAAELAAALKRAGAALVVLAGKPGVDAPDVDTFAYTGCDAVSVLDEVLAVLGVS